jgi:hypothetical protein
MIQGYVANYTNDATHKMTYVGAANITITYKLAPMVSPKDNPIFEENYKAITGAAITNADFDQWHVRVINNSVEAAGYIKFNFSDGVNDYQTNWICIEGSESVSLFMYCQEVDAGANVAFDSILQAS